MQGKIVINGYYHSPDEEYRCQKLLRAFDARGVCVEVYRNNLPYREENFPDDFILFFDKDVHLSRLLENSGKRVFNRTDVLEITDNKNAAYAFLKGKTKVELPATYPAPKKFFPAPDRSYSDAVASLLGFPLVVKEACGSLGKQVYLVRDKEELYRKEEELGATDRLYQRFRGESYGKSVRIICIGGKAIGGILLTSENDFRSNAHLGGKATVFPLTDEYRRAAEEIASLIGADYCGIDFFADKPILIEINGNAYFREFERITGKDVAELYVDHILETFSPCEGM